METTETSTTTSTTRTTTASDTDTAKPDAGRFDVVQIPIRSILVADRIRTINRDQVAELKESIQEIGLIHPIVVTEANTRGTHHLVCGAHRLRAIKELEWETVPAHLVPRDEERNRLMEAFENLKVSELSPREKEDLMQAAREAFAAIENRDKGLLAMITKRVLKILRKLGE